MATYFLFETSVTITSLAGVQIYDGQTFSGWLAVAAPIGKSFASCASDKSRLFTPQISFFVSELFFPLIFAGNCLKSRKFAKRNYAFL